MKTFAETESMTSADRETFLARAKDICSRSSRDRSELDFTALANELVSDDPSRLLDVLTDPDRGLNDRFVPDGRVLQTLVKYKVSTRFWSLEFARDALSRGEIQYNAEDRTLIIRDLPDELVRELRIELPDG